MIMERDTRHRNEALCVPIAAILTLALSLAILMPGFAVGSDLPEADLHELYRSVRPDIEASPYGIPLLIRSEEREDRSRGEVLGVLEHPFPLVSAFLAQPESWCEIALLHLNTKACTWSGSKGQEQVTFYTGRKHYQAPEQAHQIRYLFSPSNRPASLRVLLSAEEGPMGTRDYMILAQAVPLEDGLTFLRFVYAYTHGVRARTAMKAYLMTLGRGKEGLSVVGRDQEGNPVYSGGIRAVVERNALRYFYAISSAMEVSHLPDGDKLLEAARVWYEHTQNHPQLYEISREEYLADKVKEIANTRGLQNSRAVVLP
jgi:hypothetical protein